MRELTEKMVNVIDEMKKKKIKKQIKKQKKKKKWIHMVEGVKNNADIRD